MQYKKACTKSVSLLPSQARESNMAAQFTLYSHAGPNSLKAAILLEKLGLSYDVIPLEAFSDDVGKGMKGKNYLAINPNGR